MVSAVSLKSKTKSFFMDRLPRATQRVFLYCAKSQLFKQHRWYLAGGTALALQAGHRQSVDLDFFTTLKTFNELSLERSLKNTGKWVSTHRERGTLYGTLLKAKMSFIAYPFFKPAQPKLRYGTLSILKVPDIAAMKIIAISQRGRKRDFLDLFWYCQNCEPLEDVLWRAMRQFPGEEHNMNHILKSLAYFGDADSDPMPPLFFKVTWPEIKNFFKKEAARLAKKAYFK